MPLIYIADDDAVYSEMVRSTLADAGYEAEVAADVTQLSAMLSKRRPAATIVDMQMPGGGGLAAVKILARGEGRPIAVVLCSGMPIPLVKEWFPTARWMAFLQKPPDMGILLQELASLLRQLPPD